MHLDEIQSSNYKPCRGFPALLDKIQSSNYKPCKGFPALNCIVIRPRTAIILSYLMGKAKLASA